MQHRAAMMSTFCWRSRQLPLPLLFKRYGISAIKPMTRKRPLPPARKSFKLTDETNSSRAIAYYIRAGVYEMKGDNEQAIADYTKAIEANSHYADAYAGRGIVYQAKGDNDHSIADYTKAIEIDPRYAEAYVGRGMIYRLNGDSDHAIRRLYPSDRDQSAVRGCLLQSR